MANVTAGVHSLVADLRGDAALIPDVRRVYEYLPDSIESFPAIVIYPIEGGVSLGEHASESGRPMMWSYHTIRIALLIARKDLERDMATLQPFIDSMPNVLLRGFENDKYGGHATVLGDPRVAQNATRPMRYSVISEAWGGVQTLGVVWDFDVSIQQEINV